MSPVLILSRLCLNRRFRLFGPFPGPPPQARLARVLTRDHDGHVVVQDLDGEVLPLLTKHLLALLLQDLAGAMMWVDDVVAELELDVLDLALLEGLEKLLFDLISDGPVLLVKWGG